MTLFSANNDVSGLSRQEATQQIVRLASLLGQYSSETPETYGQRNTFTEQAKDKLLKDAFTKENGKIALAQAMALPIRKNLDYKGIARQQLVIDELPTGALPVYEKDIDVSAVVISNQGSVPESQVYGDNSLVPLFTLATNPTIKINQVRQRRFAVIERAMQKARQEIQALEDSSIFAALEFAGDAALDGENAAVSISSAMRKDDLVDVMQQVIRHDNILARYFMNINEYADILRWTSQTGTGSADFDPVSQRELLQTGIYGKIFNTDIRVSKLVPSGTVFGCADAEFVGVMPIRNDIEALPADEPRALKLGWILYEEIGLGILNSRGVALGRK